MKYSLLSFIVSTAILCGVYALESKTPQLPRPTQYYIDYALLVDVSCPPTEPTRTISWIDSSDKNNIKYRTRTFGISCGLKWSHIDYYYFLSPNGTGYQMQPYIVFEDVVCVKPRLQPADVDKSLTDIFRCVTEYVGSKYSPIAKKDCDVFKSNYTLCPLIGDFNVYIDPETGAPVEFIDDYDIPRPVKEYKTGPDAVDGAFNPPPDFLCKKQEASDFQEKYGFPLERITSKVSKQLLRLLRM